MSKMTYVCHNFDAYMYIDNIVCSFSVELPECFQCKVLSTSCVVFLSVFPLPLFSGEGGICELFHQSI